MKMILLTLSALLVSCSGSHADDVNKPLARSEVKSMGDNAQTELTISSFAKKNNFAIQPLLNQPRGLLKFVQRLFRDDITIVISQMDGDNIEVAAYPLCACELGRRVGLQSDANAAVEELAHELSTPASSSGTGATD
ncbi:MAG: hypothetical protein ACJ8ER_04000 [Allosphingosinicella sp.]